MKLRRNKETAFTLRFHQEADGGAEHVLWVLEGFVFQFRKNGKVIAEGAIKNDEYLTNDEPTIYVSSYNADTGLYDGNVITLKVFGDFDEVIYL
jgi:hypothetical protein